MSIPVPTPAFQAPGNDPWKLVWTDRATATPPLLWNGLMGVRIGIDGLTTDAADKPLPMFLIDEYDPQGSESIRGINNPLMFNVDIGEKSPNPRGIASAGNWSQTLDLRTGIVETSFDLPTGGRAVAQAVLDPSSRQVAYRLSISNQEIFGYHTFGVHGSYNYGFSPNEPGTEWRDFTQDGLHWSGVFGPSKTQAALLLAMPKDLQSGWDSGGDWDANGSLPKSATHSFDQTLSLGASPNLANMNPGVDYTNAIWKAPAPLSFDQIAARSAKAWGARWKTDIEIDGPVEDQQAVRSFLFYLRSAISPEGGMSISPMGLSNDLYGGHVFWDADMWVMPALAFVQTEGAKAIAEYRLNKLRSASMNFREWWLAGGPTAKPEYKVANDHSRSGLLIACKFPWESSVTGKETAPGPSRFEDHISGSVAFSLATAAALGLIDSSKVSQVVSGVSDFYFYRSTEDADHRREIKAVMSPDENHIGDNDLYTNLLAQWCANGGSWQPDMTRPPLQYKLPQDKTSFLTYDNDPIKSYKQAAAVLAIYPLQFPRAEAQAKAMMDRFADKVIKNGPAMTDSVHSIIWTRMGEPEKAYDTWRKGWMEFVRPPFLLFSEKRGQDRSYFATGAAGELNSVIYGFLGFRIDSKPEAGANWSIKLRGDRFLSVKPNLPNAWKRVTFRNFHVLGKTYTLTATHQSVQVTQGD